MRDPEVSRALATALKAMRGAETENDKLIAIHNGAETLGRLGDDGSGALEELNDNAVHVHCLDPNFVKSALAQGIEQASNAALGRATAVSGYADANVRAKGFDWPEPDMRLVDDDCVPAPSLLDGMLPAGWNSWIAAEATARATPRDYVAASLIGCASAWIGNARRVAATADWSEPAHLWLALIGAPSAGKTPALAPMITVSRNIERDEDFAWRLTHQDDEKPPPGPRVIAMDTSTDELQHMLSRSPRGLLYVRDELAGWIGSFDRYNGRGTDRTFALEAWNGGVYVCDRVKYRDDPVRIEHCSLAVVGCMVPDRLREVLADADDGLAARLLYVWPDPAPITPLQDRGNIDTGNRRDVLQRAAGRLHGLAMGASRHGTPAPAARGLDANAFRLFDDIRQQAMRRARETSGMMAGWHGKNPGRALRLALVYELLAWAVLGDDAEEPATIAQDSMVRAGAYLDYTAGMLERIEGGFGIGRARADAAKIARYLRVTGAATLNERELYQARGWTWLRADDRRRPALQVLQLAGWIRHAVVPSGGGRARGDWEVSPRIEEGRRANSDL
jgi:hypothetical protein